MAVIMLDAGHGGFDNGASYEGRLEKDDNLNLVLAIGNNLENRGEDVLYTRTTDIYQSPNEKANIANRSDAAYFISIHRNSSPIADTYSGVQTLVYADSGIPALFAKNINAELEKVGFANLGTSVRPNLAVLKGTDMPAALVEVGFINTDKDNKLLDLKFPEVVKAIAEGILITVQGAGVESSEVDAYVVELGMFMHYENAKSLADNLQEDGYPSKIQPLNTFYRVIHGKFSDIAECKRREKELFDLGYEARSVEY